MQKRFTFTLPASLTGLEEHPTVERDLKRFHKKYGDSYPPESVWRVANAMLADESRKLAFSTRQPYILAMREVLQQKPHLLLGAGVYVRNRDFAGDVDFIDEEVRDDDAA